MEASNIYETIAKRTNGDIYVGIVGPVRTGKSTFIKRFMDTVVLPHMEDEAARERATDELPQSASGRTIMTTEPKFIPEQGAQVKIDESASFRVRLIDCVGYIIPSSIGYIEEGMPRMVQTPWYEEAIPFNMAAELGTKKVITEHSTIGLVVTTDGSITDIPRDEYREAEERVIEELQEMNKPFVVLLNSLYPQNEETQNLALELQGQYKVPVIPVSCMDLSEEEIRKIVAKMLFEFPIKEISVNLPGWVMALEKNNGLRNSLVSCIRDAAGKIHKIRELVGAANEIRGNENLLDAAVSEINLGSGSAKMDLAVRPELFYKILGDKTGLPIENESELLKHMQRLAAAEKEYEKVKSAYKDVLDTGYGIVMPGMEELTFEEPEIIRQGGKYGVRLKAGAPAIHMMRTRIETEITPIVGSEEQSEELIMYLLREFDEEPTKIWESNILGKSLHELVNEGLHNKLLRMPDDARMKMRETIERIINEGCNGLICIIL